MSKIPNILENTLEGLTKIISEAEKNGSKDDEELKSLKRARDRILVELRVKRSE